ncbi:hypothetical protein HNQ91_006011 [Filimonas zeae]|uniref:Uncharacterized protein n=1 Tax=Filimonas zeae TaxID=1737353 RepID=A0A917J7H0_9BACT|nr:hypothetical protein [Filimonas zeae]MDR6342924.1 hypothetical protein [Filimonas zeae]GGH83248.1 hypothetical protein GCM10011379_58350 [Filimonas zeae]
MSTLFRAGNRRSREESGPDVILSEVLEYTPELYKTSTHFSAASSFLINQNWELALNSLVQLAEESGHYFSEDFWLNLALCANKINQPARTDHCRRQIERIKSETGLYAPKGWTIIKVADNIHTFQIARVIKERWKKVQHDRDNLYDLLGENGFHLKPFGDGGTIYYIENGKVLEIDFKKDESGQCNMLLVFEEIKYWIKPFEQPFTGKEKETVRTKLLAWLKKKQLKTDLLA